MQLWKCTVYNMIFIVLLGLWSSVAISEVVELGEASLFGSKPQPEAVLIVSKAPTEDNVVIPTSKISQKIVESVNDEIFRVGDVE